ncbi:RND family transporter, partial [Alkaliphilus sp. AH-315-G20]|nr:RND family transporter [Alkaliphilus sp. AH-315-G20]
VRWRLLSLLMVGISAVWTFGLMGYLGVPLSMATMAVLPVLIGLGIDYSVQFHNHFQEEMHSRDSIDGALVTSAISMFPSAGVALLATIIGFITLYISDVPMVQDFGVILSAGVFLSYVSALFLLHSVLYILEKKTPVQKLKKSASKQRFLEKALGNMARKILKSPILIFAIAIFIGIIGVYADSQLVSSTDFKELMSQDAAVLQDIEKISELSGTGPPQRFLIEADDVTSPEFLKWLSEHQKKMLKDFPVLLSVESIATLVHNASNNQIPNNQNQIDFVLDNTPAVFVDQFISSDKKSASLLFSVEHITMEEQNLLIKEIELAASKAPYNIRKVAVGSVALGASTIDSIMGKRFFLNMLCLFAIMVVLFVVYKRFVSVILTIISVGLIISWSSLVLFVSGIPLNPLTAILGVIVIGIGTEFMVLIISRYEDEKKKGNNPTEAMVIAISKIGRAVVITALTTLGGFGVLMTSSFVLIRDFGIATVSGVLLCLISSMIVMPPLLVFFDEKALARKK